MGLSELSVISQIAIVENSTGSKFCFVSNFTWLHALTQHALTQVTHSYVLLQLGPRKLSVIRSSGVSAIEGLLKY